MFVMMWADPVKEVGSLIYLIQQHTSNMGLTLFSLFLVSLDPSWTQKEIE